MNDMINLSTGQRNLRYNITIYWISDSHGSINIKGRYLS